ncbi:hypothetical protein NDU88_000521 [Pleurodeles waltl]|uniref:Uncharacterized protein n=1 Tax=Pleurodeles waltl TaxID=8319 RepID=A0AAV7P9Y1_PLEWA|nr:hypothetical protein NDU88_000521 [Pleurodeles waltl]
MQRSGVTVPYAPSLPVMAIADGQMYRDGGVRGFLREAGLTELRDWMVDGRLLDVSEVLAGCEGTALQRMYVIRVRSLLRTRLCGSTEAPLEFRALEALCSAQTALLGCVEDIRATHRRLVGLLLLLAKRRVAMCVVLNG